MELESLLNDYYDIPNIENLIRLLDLNVDINQEILNNTLLMCAVKNVKFYDTVILLLEKGADINKVNENSGMTPLMWAIVNNKCDYQNDIVKLLLDKGANINLQDRQYRTVLMHIIITLKKFNRWYNNDKKPEKLFDIVKLLLNKDAKINTSCKNGNTALMYVMRIRHNIKLDIVDLLLDKGAKINKVNKDGDTALIIAASNALYIDSVSADYDVIKLLLYKRANLYINNKEGENFFSYIFSNVIKNKKIGLEFLKIIDTIKYSEMCMEKIFKILKIYSQRFLSRPTSLRTTLINIKWDMVDNFYELLKKKYKCVFQYFGIYDQDSMKLKITENIKLMEK